MVGVIDIEMKQISPCGCTIDSQNGQRYLYVCKKHATTKFMVDVKNLLTEYDVTVLAQ